MADGASGAVAARRAAEPRTRVRLCGPLGLELKGRSVAADLRGRQSRLVVAYLVTHRERAVGRGELIAMLWPERAPKEPQAQLRPILSGLRKALGGEALEGKDQLRLALPDPVWVDTEAAAAAVTAARHAAREGDWRGARVEARTALDLLEPDFLPGQSAEWIEARRRELEDTELEAFEWEARGALALGGGELGAAEFAARRVIARSPYRESGHRYLMEALAAEGNAAEALRVYDELRLLLREELGAFPAPALQALHERILRGDGLSEIEPIPAPRVAPGVGLDRTAREGERKQVTVLCCELADSMSLQHEIDPEASREVMDRFLQILTAGVERFEGTVDRFTGDGIVALFGAPIAHEDHARRASHAALHLRGQLAAYAAELRRERGIGFSIRIGLNSGEVVVGAIGRDLAMAYTAVGYTVGLAKRIAELADSDRVYVSEHTAALVEGYFALADAGTFEIKDAAAPLQAYELTGPGFARGALDVARARGLSRFVGRDEELRTLLATLEQARTGQGQVIGVVGEPGVGKSRLCHELAERCRAQKIAVWHVAGQAHARTVPLMPVLQLMRTYFGITDRDPDETARERIVRKLLPFDRVLDVELPLLFDFLSVPDPERPVERMDAEARQRRLLALMKRITHVQSAHKPGLTVIEDLHWLDPASEVFLANLVEAVQGAPGLTVLNFRPEYRAPWMARSYYRQLALAPLGEDAMDELLDELLGSHASLDELRGLIRERTGGNPFFTEELARSLVEAGSLDGERGAYRLTRPQERLAVPATVQTVLAARIDRLPAKEKGVLQAASVIGKEFPRSVLERVVGLEPEELEQVVAALIAGEFAYERSFHPEPVYAFRHPLTQEVAYGSQLTERRSQVHGAVAHAIADQYPERLDEQAALIAQHCDTAGETLDAARWYARAAAWSGFTDPTDARRHWEKVRELADRLPDVPEAARLALEARIMSLQLGVRVGVSAPEAQQLFEKGDRIAAAAGDLTSRAFLLASYAAVKGFVEGDVREHAALLRRATVLADQSGEPATYVSIAFSAIAFLYIGEYREGVAILDRAIELAGGDPAVGAGIAGDCPFATCLCVKGGFLAYMGELDQARDLIEEGRRIAGDRGALETVGWSHVWSVSLAYCAGDAEAAVVHARQAVEIAERIGDRYSRPLAWTMLAWAESMREEWQRALVAYARADEIRDERLNPQERPALLASFAEMYFGVGDLRRTRELIEDARAEIAAASRGFIDLAGGVALARVLLAVEIPGARAEVESLLTSVLDVAGETGAKAFEPQVHVELAELARRLGDDERRERELLEAHRLFTAIGATGHAERVAAELAATAT